MRCCATLAANWYRAKCNYEATSEDEVSFPHGALVQVIQKKLDGWWLIR